MNGTIDFYGITNRLPKKVIEFHQLGVEKAFYKCFILHNKAAS
ncbi:hypothetical protein [Bacillus sp. AY2-1]|nr:hypothetical protein [Bacillus sp. AY2-1]